MDGPPQGILLCQPQPPEETEPLAQQPWQGGLTPGKWGPQAQTPWLAPHVLRGPCLLPLALHSVTG